MRKRTAVFWAIAALSIGILTLTFVACGGDKNLPTGDSGMPTSSAPAPAPVATNPQPAPNPIGAPGIDVALVSSTFDPDRCTDLTQPQHSGKTELVEVAKVTNNTDREVYAKPAIYHSDIATCGALDTNPGGIVGLMEAENIPPGQSKNWTHRFTIPENACGAYQFDNDAKNGVISRSTLGNGDGGKVINTGRNCPSCEAFNVQLTVTGEGLTRTVKVTFAGQKPAKKALVDFGDGTSAELTNGQSVSHTWKYGEYIVKATLEAEGISCYNSTIVKNEEQCVPEWKELEPEITYGEWGECKKPAEASASDGEPQCSQSRTVRTVIKEQNSCTKEIRVKSDNTTTESRPCECKSEDTGVCHVATNGNWQGDGGNVVVTYKQNETPGHSNHLDPTKQCPPDYIPAGTTAAVLTMADVEALTTGTCKVEGPNGVPNPCSCTYPNPLPNAPQFAGMSILTVAKNICYGPQ